MLLKLNDTMLVFLKPPEMDPQVVQVTLKTPRARPTVNQLAEFHLSQAIVSNALLRVIQTDIILCANADAAEDNENGVKESGKSVVAVGKKVIFKDTRDALGGDGVGGMKPEMTGLPREFVITAEGYSIHCYKERWLHPLDRWLFSLGEKEILPAIHKWRFRWDVVED